MFKLSIRANLLTVFIVLITVVTASLMFSQYYFNKKLAIESVSSNFSLISNNISKTLDRVNNRIIRLLHASKSNQRFYQKIELNYKHPALHDMLQLINIDKSIYALYFTDKYDSLYEVINIEISNQLYTQYNAPANTKVIILIHKNQQTLLSFLDKKDQFISQKFIQKYLDPKSRIWYKKAIESQGIVTSGIYQFASSNVSGFTFAMPLENDSGVFAIDYTVSTLDKLLKSQRFGKQSNVFIFNPQGKIVSSSSTKRGMIDARLFTALQEGKKKEIIFYKKDDKGYLSIYRPLHNNLYLGFKITAHTLFEPFIASMKYSFAIAFLVLLISIPVIFLITSMIVRPIKGLIKENEKIKNRDFQDVKAIKTNVIEFVELSESFVTMSSSIQEYQKSQAALLDSIVKLIAQAVDAKSPYTGGHCERVPLIAQLLINAASDSSNEALKDFSMKEEDQLKEFEIGAWLHDCGKVTTPEYVVDKATKLETINNRIHEIRTRFEVLWRDAQITYLESQLKGEDKDKSLQILNTRQKKLLDDFEFIATVNIGGEYMSREKQERVKEIAQEEWLRYFDKSLGLGVIEKLRLSERKQNLPAKEKLLCDKPEHIIERENFNYNEYKKEGFKEEIPEHLYNYGEIYNLCIEKGTLTKEERYKINEHVIMSIKMLEKIPFPSNMTRIPEYAGTHHETLIGTGYPRKLTKEELSIPARVMAIADIFEALTASDRPYKKAKTLSQALKIMSFMVKDQHIDKDLFELFIKDKIYLTYAKEYLKPEQIDTIIQEDYISNA